MTRPLAVDLCCGLSGWAEGLVAEGFDVVGFDLEDMFKTLNMPKHKHFSLVIQDVLTIHGRQFKDAKLIVASPPCQFFSYCAMPWTRAKALAAEVRSDPVRTEKELAIFNACFRIAAQASLAAGRKIPLVVENVRGAQPWVGRARWNYGSFYLWGDVPALMPFARHLKQEGVNWSRYNQTGGAEKSTPDWTQQATKVPGFRFDGSGRSFQTASVEGVKVAGLANGRFPPGGLAQGHIEGVKQAQDADFVPRQRPGMNRDASGGDYWFQDGSSRHGSRSPARKAASAMIAKIPLPLARHIAAVYRDAA